MRILVTGHRGYIGTVMVPLLVQDGHDVVGIDTDLYELSEERLAKIVNVPGSLAEAMDALEADHAFLLDGGVFTDDLIEEWISYKRAEAKEIDLRPHPWEFVQSYDG